MHYRRWSLTGDPGPATTIRVAGEITPCEVQDCERLKRSSGADYCEMHYYRMRRTGDAGSASANYTPRPRVCAVDDCDDAPRTGSAKYCGLHSEQKRRIRTPKLPKPSMPVVCSVDGCGRKRQEAGMCKMHATRVRRHGNPHTYVPYAARNLARGERSGVWSGENATYSAVHQRLKRERGSARKHACFDCGAKARQWSYDHADPDERRGGEGAYSLTLDRYQPRCVPCHKTYDLAYIAHLQTTLLADGTWRLLDDIEEAA